jgi:hypothetical protein
VVSECIFWWCVNTISAELVNSTVIENITNSVQVPSTFSDNPWKDAASSWFQSLYTLNLEDDQAEGGYANFSVNNVTARFTYQALEVHSPRCLGPPKLTKTQELVPHAWLPGFQVLPAEALPSPGQAYVKFLWRVVGNGINLQLSNVNASQWLPPSNVTRLITSMAHDMSTSLRRSTVGFSTEIPQWAGAAWDQQTRVRIRWGWIILPTCLLAFSFLFLAVTIALSEGEDKKKIGVWKSSVLAVLFNGLGEDVREHVGGAADMAEAREKARHLQVQLDH